MFKYVYLLRAGQHHYKVGVAVNVTNRVKGVQTGNPLKIECVTAKLVHDAYVVEQRLHATLFGMKADGGQEWFTLTPEQALDLAVQINAEPDVDINHQLTVEHVLQASRSWQKSVSKQLDLIINNYQTRPTVGTQGEADAEQADHTKDAHDPAPKRQELLDLQFAQDLAKAEDIVKEQGKASTSLLQRHMRLGYGRAARIMDELEAKGVIGPAYGSRPRDVLVV